MLSRQSLELRQSQQLALTPQLQQSIRFLQLSALDLEAEVALALEENPLLERDEEYDTEAAQAESERRAIEREGWSVLAAANRAHGADEEYAGPEASEPDSLTRHLMDQLQTTHVVDRDRVLLELLIGELDENGYLTTSLDEIVAYLPVQMLVEPDELRIALRLLQSFDPPGVGARSLSECLLLQLEIIKDKADPQVFACACELARHHLALLASGNLKQLCLVLSCTQEQLRVAHGLLLGLDPKPGRAWAGSQAGYVNPEVIVSKVGRRWRARLNAGVAPRLRVNALYEKLLRESGGATSSQARKAATSTSEPASGLAAAPASAAAPEGGGLSGHIQSAHGLVKSVAQRFETILRVGQAVVERQQAFFEQGPRAMRPLLLRDIAQELGMHESTISRATRQKYIQTPWGVFELKHFFGAALNTEDGDATSAKAVQSMIQKLVAQERAEKPLSDSQLVTGLAGQGVVIARRTVAKYREAAGIETATLRKSRAFLAAGQTRKSPPGAEGSPE